MNSERVVELLDDAIGDLQASGWTQGVFRNEAGAICALTAIYCQADRGYSAAEVHAARLAFAGIAGISPVRISTWNDDPGRTAEEVILTFKKAREMVAEGTT